MFRAVLFFVVTLILFLPAVSNAGFFDLKVDTDSSDRILFGFFDLRDRETHIQITNVDSEAAVVHVQIFNVNDNCTENNFFDAYTPNDTHVYNLRDLLTNDGNPSGVILPENAYGIITIGAVQGVSQFFVEGQLIGNLRVIDNAGYEYRTNLAVDPEREFNGGERSITFNFNNQDGIVLSDIYGVTVRNINQANLEVEIDQTFPSWFSDVDIYDLNEVAFSCRNVVFACVNQNSSRLTELLEEINDNGEIPGASVASFDYGINEAIPHSRGGELLCPNNIVEEGVVTLDLTTLEFGTGGGRFILFTGLNDGNGRGSLDSYWFNNFTLVN